MFTKNNILIALTLLIAAVVVPVVGRAQQTELPEVTKVEGRHGISVDFRVNSVVIDPLYRNNAKALKQIDENGNVTDIDMPEPSNVLQYFTASGHKVSVRPSGTEPKIKFYMEAKGKLANRNEYANAIAEADKVIEAMKEAMGI